MADYHAVTEAMRIAYEQTRLLREVMARRKKPQVARRSDTSSQSIKPVLRKNPTELNKTEGKLR